MENLREYLIRWILFAGGALAVHVGTFIGIAVLFLVIFVIDFITGCVASFIKGKQIESYRLRWSFVKTFCYFGTFVFTAITGVCVNNVDTFIEILKLQVYVALWIECVSITENLIKIFPGIIFIEYLHYMLSTVWVKKISGLMNFFKEKGEKR